MTRKTIFIPRLHICNVYFVHFNAHVAVFAHIRNKNENIIF